MPKVMIEFLFILLVFVVGWTAIPPKEYPCINGTVHAKHNSTFYKLVDNENLPLKCEGIQ